MRGPQPEAPEAARTDDMALVQGAYARVLADLPAHLRTAGWNLLVHLNPSDWELEWSLPRWLAEPFALSENVVDHLVCANILGLGHIRLGDDLRDHEVWIKETAGVERLARVLYEAAVFEYSGLLGAHAWFWSQVEGFLRQWRSAGVHLGSIDVLHATDRQIHQVAHAGSPLYICCAAVLALKGREASLAEITEPIRHYLIASVLIDHMADWGEDLEVGRPNLFAQALLHDRLSDWPAAETVIRFQEAFLQQQLVQAYLGLVGRHLDTAISLSRRQGLDGLGQYLERRRRATRQESEDLAQAMDRLRGQAVDLLFKTSTS